METSIKVNNIYPSIQGEGALAGTPMVILRLQGCSVGCSFCDTKETWEPAETHKVAFRDAMGVNAWWTELAPLEIADEIHSLYPAYSWVLLTGGEPAEQDITELVKALHGHGYKVALETSGTALGHIPQPWKTNLRQYRADWITVSPKHEFKPVLQGAIDTANEVKFVIGGDVSIKKMQAFLGEFTLPADCVVSLQPMSQSARATKLCIETIKENPHWRLSIQIHKYLNLP